MFIDVTNSHILCTAPRLQMQFQDIFSFSKITLSIFIIFRRNFCYSNLTERTFFGFLDRSRKYDWAKNQSMSVLRCLEEILMIEEGLERDKNILCIVGHVSVLLTILWVTLDSASGWLGRHRWKLCAITIKKVRVRFKYLC